MEEKILNVISEVTGVSTDDIKGNKGKLAVFRARLMYYYLCNDKGLLFKPVANLINRTASAASYGAASFAIFVRKNKMYENYIKEAKNMLLGMKMGDSIDWVAHNGHEYIYVKGVKYSIHDVSSRYFGKGYMGMIDGNYALYSEDKSEAIQLLIEMANKI